MFGTSRGQAFAILFITAAAGALAAPTTPASSPNVTSTVSGKSTCLTQYLQIDVVSNNIKLLLDQPANQTVVTEILVELLQNNSVLFSQVNGGPTTIKDTFNIYGKLCVPSDPSAAKAVKTVQFLTHGDTLDNTYWDIAPGYSYSDAVVAAGYATFSYDRIGVGRSDHPDPLQVVQGPLQVEVAHALVGLLRKPRIHPYGFKNIIGVGHSAGSTVTQGVTTKYPQDFDAVILTGTSTSVAYVNTAVASFDLTIANLDPSGKFAGLPNGYLVQPTTQSIQFPFFRWPNFDPKSASPSPYRIAADPVSSSRCRGCQQTNPDIWPAPYAWLDRSPVPAVQGTRGHCTWRERPSLLRWRLYAAPRSVGSGGAGLLSCRKQLAELCCPWRGAFYIRTLFR